MRRGCASLKAAIWLSPPTWWRKACIFYLATPPRSVAQKALRVNLSDLAAKGAAPIGYVLGAGFGAGADERWIGDFAEGLRADQAEFRIELLGGDTISVTGPPVFSITAFGAVPAGRMVHRFGGRPGDALYVSGTIGAATAGLALLQGRAGAWDQLSPAGKKALVDRYRVPNPRIKLAPALVRYASAAMDISDGLVGDCDKLAGVSGCAASIDAEHVPLAPGLSELPNEELLPALLSGGDDYEILAGIPAGNEAGFRAAAEKAGVPVARIGELREGSGLTDVRFQGRPLALQGRAYEHGRQP
jgi:thiamine-monophosphate kinase